MSDKQIVDMLVSVQTEYVPKSEVVRLNAEVERLTRELDNARAWSARWKAVAKRIWTGVHHPLDMCESEARRREAAERERDALAAQVAALREAGEQMAGALDDAEWYVDSGSDLRIEMHTEALDSLTAEVERLTRELDAERHHRINLDVIAKNLTVKCDQQTRALETSRRSVDDWREAWEQKQIELERAEAERDAALARIAALEWSLGVSEEERVAMVGASGRLRDRVAALERVARASQGIIHEGLHGGRPTDPEHQELCEMPACRRIRAALAAAAPGEGEGA